MAFESSRIELKLAPDPRLAAAVGGAVSHVGERLGLDPGAQSEFAEAAEQACREALSALAGEKIILDVIVADFPDRIEVTVSRPGAAPAARRNTSAAAGARSMPAEKPRRTARRKGVDRIRYEDRSGASRLTLIKFLAKKPEEL